MVQKILRIGECRSNLSFDQTIETIVSGKNILETARRYYVGANRASVHDIQNDLFQFKLCVLF